MKFHCNFERWSWQSVVSLIILSLLYFLLFYRGFAVWAGCHLRAIWYVMIQLIVFLISRIQASGNNVPRLTISITNDPRTIIVYLRRLTKKDATKYRRSLKINISSIATSYIKEWLKWCISHHWTVNRCQNPYKGKKGVLKRVRKDRNILFPLRNGIL